MAEARSRDHNGPLRLEQQLKLAEVDEHRREWCANYPDCFDHAVTGNWPSFTCVCCDGFYSLPKRVECEGESEAE